MAKNLILGPILACLTQVGLQNFFRGSYLYLQLGIVPSYHPMQFPRKLTNQTSENGEKPNFGPDFGSFGPNFNPPFICGFYLC